MKRHLHFFFRATALIFLWRGVWHLMDLFLFPTNPLYSNVTSLIVGALLLLIADVIFFVPEIQESPEERRVEKEYGPQE